MVVRVFYAWQSNRRQNRNFIRSALEAAVKQLRQDLALEEAQRDIILDQDTQGLPGSPAIADAILTKIRSTDVFIGDLTFIDGDLSTDAARDTRRTPNPNVMLEYGYALHALGDVKIIGVFNEAYGSPQQLPFDLAHRRWPIRFNLPNGESANRQNEKQRLTSALKEAVRSIISQFEEPEAPAGAPAVHEWGEVDAYRITQAYLQPMGGMRVGNWRSGRHQTGSVVYSTTADNPESAWDASQLFLTRELWANDFYHVYPERDQAKQHGFPFIPTGAVEEVSLIRSSTSSKWPAITLQ